MVRSFHVRAVLTAMICAAALALPGTALAWESPVEGGVGGGPFRVQCPAGNFIVGFEGRSGAVIDHIRLICGAVTGNPQRLRRSGPLNINVGTSSGGAPALADCPDGWGIRAIAFENTWDGGKQSGFVHHINLQCTSLASLDSIWRTYGPPGPVPTPSTAFFSKGKYFARSSQFDCPSGQFATGLHGRSGLYVDALGLICAPLPAAAPMLPPQTGLTNQTDVPLSKRAITGTLPPAPAPLAAPPPPIPGMQGQNPVDDQGRMATRATGFTGNWDTHTDKGWSYAMQLQQNGNTVNGSYVAQNGANGRLSGRIRNGVLEFNWTQDGGFRGTGQFALAPDGNSFSGTYRTEPNRQITDPRYLQGSWSGTRR